MAQILQFRTYLKDKKMEYNVTITQYLQSTFFISKHFLGYFDYKISFRYPQYNPTDRSIITMEKLAILPVFLMKRTFFCLSDIVILRLKRRYTKVKENCTKKYQVYLCIQREKTFGS